MGPPHQIAHHTKQERGNYRTFPSRTITKKAAALFSATSIPFSEFQMKTSLAGRTREALCLWLRLSSDRLQQRRQLCDGGGDALDDFCDAGQRGFLVVEDAQQTLGHLRRKDVHRHGDEVADRDLRRHGGDHLAVAVLCGAELAHGSGDKLADAAAPLGVLCVVQAAVDIDLLVRVAHGRRQRPHLFV